ncbi:DUF4221 family protein [Algoriphagus confluentis]|uniref:DUF4221 domain-containing protein n=1 Tax=Algoriphagus confluentis TaxID=1697556 RepID=A0ABQ6PTZ2_9BACT|nr:hypothetical protein Aconfl_38620 [Algoriphagus confluentis]
MKKFFSIISILFILLGCTQQTPIKDLKSTIHQTIRIPLELDISPNRTSFQYINSDSGEYLAFQNKIGPRIEIFNLDSKHHVTSIKLAQDGPNRVGIANGFRIIAQDCLLIASIPPSIKILNFEGIKHKDIPVLDTINHVNFLSSNNEIPFLFSDHELFGAQPFFRNFFETTPKDVSSYSHIYKVNLTTEKAEWLPISHPSDAWDEGKKTPNFTWTDRNDSIVVSPQTDHRLWIISKRGGNLLGYKEVHSTSVNRFQIIKGLPEGDKGIIEALASDRYELILHDPFRDVFYRFFFMGVDWENYNLGYRNLYSNRPKIGVLVLDKNLEVIGEKVFDDNYLEAWNYFVGRKGLYVSTNNPNRDDFDENILRYDIIRFEGLEYED